MKCPACGGADLIRGPKVIKSVYKDDTIEVEVAGEHCSACGESVLDAESSVRYMAAMRDQRIRVDGEHETNRTFIRAVRVKLGLTQRKAGELFGGGPNAFSRYERGHTRPPQALLQLFRVLNAQPESAQFLAGYEREISKVNDAANIAHEAVESWTNPISALNPNPFYSLLAQYTPGAVSRQAIIQDDDYSEAVGSALAVALLHDSSGMVPSSVRVEIEKLQEATARARELAASQAGLVPFHGGMFAQHPLYHGNVTMHEPPPWEGLLTQVKKSPTHG
jgi:HTH-type transcriptional regulator/antitoxin MqsA